jgi:hypothetical protein
MIEKVHVESATVVLRMQLEDAVWEVLRFGGYDKSQPCNKLVRTIHDDLAAGRVACTEFYTYRKLAEVKP